MPPDQARYRKLRRIAYSLGACAFVIAFFHRVAPGAIAADLRDAFGASATMLGFIAALYFYPYAAMQLPSGLLADTVGPRKLFAGGLLVAGAGSLLFAYAPSVGWLLAGRGLVGLGVAVAFVSVLKLIASWYREQEFGTWVGMLMLAGNLGGVLAASPLAWVTRYVSWRDVFAVVGVLSVVLALAIWLWVRDDPRDAGLDPPSPAAAALAPGKRASLWTALAQVAGNADTWPVFIVHLCLIGSYLTFFGLWAVPYMTDGLGMSRVEATLHITVAILTFAVASGTVGTVSDRMRRRLPLLRGLSVLFVACWLPWVMGWSMPGYASYAAFALMGIGISGASLAWALAKELNPPSLSGTATSLVNTAGFLGTALFQPLVGWMIDRGGGGTIDDYRRGAAVLAAIAVVGLVAAFRVRETGCRNAWRGQPA